MVVVVVAPLSGRWFPFLNGAGPRPCITGASRHASNKKSSVSFVMMTVCLSHLEGQPGGKGAGALASQRGPVGLPASRLTGARSNELAFLSPTLLHRARHRFYCEFDILLRV